MAKKEKKTTRPDAQFKKTIPAKFKGMSYGKNKLTLGMEIEADKLTEHEASSALVNSRLKFKITNPKDVSGQQALPGMDKEVDPIAFEADVSSVTFKSDGYTCSLSIDHSAIELDEFKKYCFRGAKVSMQKIGASGETGDEEEDESKLPLKGDKSE